MELEQIIELAMFEVNRPDLTEYCRLAADSVVRAAHGVEEFTDDIKEYVFALPGPLTMLHLLAADLHNIRNIKAIQFFDDPGWMEQKPIATDFRKWTSSEGSSDYFGFRDKRGYVQTGVDLTIYGVPETATSAKIIGTSFPLTGISADGVTYYTESWIAKQFPEILVQGFAIRAHYIAGKTDSLGQARQMYGELLNQMISTKAGEIYGRRSS